MHQFHHVGGTECGMGGPMIGSVYCDEVLIADCVNEPVFFPEQQMVVFLLYVEGWEIHRGTKPLMAFHATTGEVWSVDPDLDYGWPCAGESIFPKVAVRTQRGERLYDVRQRKSPTGTLRMEWINAPACDACRVVRQQWTCVSCAECTAYHRGFWSALFPAISRAKS